MLLTYIYIIERILFLQKKNKFVPTISFNMLNCSWELLKKKKKTGAVSGGIKLAKLQHYVY